MSQTVQMPGPRGKPQPMYDPNTGNYSNAWNWSEQAQPASNAYATKPYQEMNVSNSPSDIYAQPPAAPPPDPWTPQGLPAGLTTNTSLNIDDVGSTTTEGNMPYWIAQMANGTEQQKALYGLLSSLYSTKGGVDIANIGAGAQMHGQDQNLAGVKYGSDADTEQARIAAAAQQAIAETNQTGVRLQDAWRREQMPNLMAFLNERSGSPNLAALGAFSPQNEQAALNTAEAAAARATEEAKRGNALQYSGSGYSVNSPSVMARNASADAAGVGNRLAAQQQIRNDFGNNRGQLAIDAQNAQTNAMSPILSLLSKLFG